MSTPVRDLMQRIEALRIEQMKHPERAAEIRAQREELRDELRFEMHRAHIEDMARAQGLGECNFFGDLDPTPHRQHHKPAPVAARWVTPVVCTVVLCGIAVGLLLEYFGVLVP